MALSTSGNSAPRIGEWTAVEEATDEQSRRLLPRLQEPLLPSIPAPPTRSVGLPAASPAIATPGKQPWDSGTTCSSSLSRLKRLKNRFQKDQKKLLEATRLITSIREPRRLFDALVSAAADLTGADRGFLLLCSSPEEAAHGKLELMSAYRMPPSLLGEADFSPSRSAISEALRTGTTVLRESETSELDASHSMQKLGIRSVLAEPIRLHDKVLGVLYLDSENNGRFRRNHVEMLPSFAAQAAICLENMRLSTEREMALRNHYSEQSRSMKLQVYRDTMSTFMQIASHDLKAPLTVLRTGFAVMKRKKGDSYDEQMLQDMEEALARAHRVVSDYLDMSVLNERTSKWSKLA